MRLATLALIFAASTARADSVYFAESFGVGMGRGGLAKPIGNALDTRLALGARVKWIALESWIGSNQQLHRDGDWHGIGGDPVAGRADLATYGVALLAITPLQHTEHTLLEGYVRAQSSLVDANGMLDAAGQGFGASVGLQLSGKVRALGFLWAPLFFIERGPKVTGAVFVDAGLDAYRFDDVHGRVHHINLGFSIAY
jgi:hypothetical protein